MLAPLAVVAAASVGGRHAPSFLAHMYNIITAHPYLASIAAIIGLYFLIPFLMDLPKRLPNEPPVVPSYIPFLGSALSFGKNPTAFLASCRARFGDIFTVNLAGRRMHFLCDPASYPALFKHRQLLFSDVVARIVLQVFDQSVASMSDAEVDRQIHQQYIKYLNGENLEKLTSATALQLRRWMRRDRAARGSGGCSEWSQVALYSFIKDLAFEAGVKAVFGEGVDVPTMQRLFYDFDKAFPLFVSGAPSFLLGAAKKARLGLNAILGRLEPNEAEAPIIAARRALFQEHRHSYSEHDVGAAQTGILWAAVADSVPAAFWTVAFLLCHPEALKAVKEEIDRVVPNQSLDVEESEERTWTRERCAQLQLTESAINEALRLATGSLVLREATTATSLTLSSGVTVSLRAGDGVSIYPALTHLDPRVFPDPLAYKVDRFLDAPIPTLNGAKLPLAFMAFGGGSTMCPGRFWAKNEILILVALLLQRCEWRVEGNVGVPPMDYTRVGIGVYQPKGDIHVHMRYR